MRDWFGHKDVKTTRIYAGHILARKTRATAQHLEGRIGWADMATRRLLVMDW